MKTLKLLSILFISVIVVSCNDDDDRDTSVDPIIGAWRTDDNEDNSYINIVFNSNGNFSSFMQTLPTDPTQPIRVHDGLNGTWSNSGTDFKSTTQTYTYTRFYGEGESETGTFSAQFSEDFNSVTLTDEYDEIIYIRQ